MSTPGARRSACSGPSTWLHAILDEAAALDLDNPVTPQPATVAITPTSILSDIPTPSPL